ncbi:MULTISPECIES: pitrilysin [Brenneria]|uniref:Protease 3 n=1 Tax=Brenneria nigrifluens DSM 30175 = ATCC 13028 TaxID=1121120 RepID=A0A2U1UVU6_9GAMM|nr:MULTISPECIES: pitrilysin [Brenneria]PWC25767.1 pitrilysin [Brenneria nigrifluens] [Brenneria nigrifluens DSM 30175 = ATCC 13028]QCR05851.1 pitrilysin [Brenneria nigrifluens] [Brenneria nigrifluens DSM 30175 = ATCC 13028]
MRRQFVWISGWLLLFIFWLPLSWAETGWQPLAQTIHKSDKDPRQYQAIKLDNGMTVLLVSDAQATKSLASLALPVGSLDDPASQLGLAHYLEHMVLMGSKRYPQPEALSEFLKKHGGSHNASTASYRTAYYLEVENDALQPAVDRLADAIAAPLLDPINADRERHAVNAEMTMARSRDGHRMAQVGAETLNPAHPSSRFSGGNLDTLSDKPGSKLHDELVKFYQRYYSANLMKGVIYSNRPLPELAALAASTFGRIANHDADVPPITVPVATEAQRGIIIHYVPAQPRKQLRIEFRVDNNSQAFRSKTDTYIGYLIGNRSQNTLSDWLQKEGLVESIGAGSDPVIDRNGGIFAISASLTDKGLARRDEVIAAIFNYLQLLRREGIQQRYFDEIANVLDLDFRYPSISRDMDYIEWLVDTMLRVPVEHTLDAVYLADRYDPQAIAARLDEMRPQNARIWLIGPNEPHNKVAYFVDAPYQVDSVPAATFARWETLGRKISLTLPAVNPYIPDDFSLIKPDTGVTHPQVLLQQPGLRVLYMPSRYFADEPRADITLFLRNQEARNSARNQVLFALNDYLAGLALDELSYQASVGGISFSTSSNDGLTIKANGYTQRLPQLLLALVEGYTSFSSTEEQLQQAKSWYAQQLEAAEKGKAFELAIQPIQALSQVPYTERAERRDLLPEITLRDIVQYRKTLLQQAAPEMLVVGNLPPQRVTELAQTLKARLNCGGEILWRSDDVRIDKTQRANLQRPGGSSDSALASVYVPTGYGEIQGMAYSSVLGQIIQPWFYSQLRTEEQLGYAVFAFPISVGRQWGIGFLLQSNSKQPAYLYQRYQDFYQKAQARLRAMSADEFAQYKQGVINELSQRPQTLDEEARRFLNDLQRENFSFDTREKLIATIKPLTVQQLADYFSQALKPQGLAVLSQISGNHHGKAEYAAPQGWHTYPDTSSLQKTLPLQKAPAR